MSAGRRSTNPPGATTEAALAAATKVAANTKCNGSQPKVKPSGSKSQLGLLGRERSATASGRPQSTSGSLDVVGSIADFPPRRQVDAARRHSSPMTQVVLSYDVHMGAGANNSEEVLLRFQTDVARMTMESKVKDARLQCELHSAASSVEEVSSFLKRNGSVVDGYQRTERGYDFMSVSMLRSALVSLLKDGCAGALASLVPAGVELLRVVDEGLTVLFHREERGRTSMGNHVDATPGHQSCAPSAMTKKQSSTTLLDKTMDILARTITIRRPSPKAAHRSPQQPRVRLHWNDRLVRRVAVLLSGVFLMEELAANLDVDLDVLPQEAADDPTDAVFLVLEEWRLNESSQDVCPRLLDLLTEHAMLQAQLEEMFEQWQVASEFLPTVISDRMLTEVARQVGNNWRSVAYELNLGRAEIEQIQPLPSDHGGDGGDDAEPAGVSLARGMLMHWRNTSGRYATRTVLARALAQCNLPDALDLADQCNNTMPGRSQLLSLVQDLMKSSCTDLRDKTGDAAGAEASASDHRRRRLAKKRITCPASAANRAGSQAGSQEIFALATVPSALQESVTSPWEATSLVNSGPYFNVDLDKLPGRSDGSLVPLLVDKCIAFIEERGMTSRGIYRLSGITSAITQLEEKFTQDHNLNLFDVVDELPERFDENCVASCLKAFLRKLPEPVVPAPITARFAEIPTLDQDMDSMVDRLKLIVVFGMSQRNRALLQEICCHLKRVAEHASENLMKASNLAVVFWPTLLRPELGTTDNMVLLRDLPRLLQNVMCLLIEHAEEIFIENQPW